MALFLKNNPFPRPLTDGLFYREKMRAIHRVSPELPFGRILEIGGGRSGLTALLYPRAEIVNLDLDAELGRAACNRQSRVSFVCGDATFVPFPPDTFDAVTLFDVLEHVLPHERVVAEVNRVLRPGGFILVSTPNRDWRYPYYRCMQRFCPEEGSLMSEWGHVRRGYTLGELEALFQRRPEGTYSFINAMTALCHDVAFSRLRRWQRLLLYLTISPMTLVGYALHRGSSKGTETASAWQKAA